LHYLQSGNSDETYKILVEAQKELYKINDVESITYSRLYYVFSEYYRAKNDYEQFYQYSLQYLAYTDEEVYTNQLCLL